MATLEYLTSNSLISYPFKSGREINPATSHPIQDDWFYDLLFVSFSSQIRNVYISKVKKTTEGDLEITFKNTETGEIIVSCNLPANTVVNHYKNVGKSFASFSSATAAIKFVLGPGLIVKEAFEQTYTAQEATIASSAVILAGPRIDNLFFETYYFDAAVSSEATIQPIASFNYPQVPTVKPNHNLTFTLLSLNNGSLEVVRGAGAGLYNPCTQQGSITDVYSVNLVAPNAEGKLFLTTSDCYTASTLTDSSELILGSLLNGYRNFKVFNSPTEYTTLDVVEANHSITFENFCSPKCPPETVSAVAHYMNRIADGAQELDYIVSRSIETRGKGSNTLKTFVADSFCVPGDDVFLRCADPADPLTFVDCGNKFIKNFHEGRTLQIYYNNITIRNYTIVDVIDDYTVKLDTVPPPAQNGDLLSFRVLDNGVISNINCAALAYNQNAATFLKPYFKVTYSTNTSYNVDGDFVTNLSVVVSIYNPSAESANIQINFTPTVLQRFGSYKVRTETSIYTIDEPVLLLGCREYAFIEALFSIPCATEGGFLEISVVQKINDVWHLVGDIYNLPEIKGEECIGTTVGGETLKYRILQTDTELFSEDIGLPSGTTTVSELYGSPPTWLSSSLASNILTIYASSAPTANTSKRYNLYFRSFGTATSIWQLIIDYIALPEIIFPVNDRFSVTTPLILSKETTYTLDNPALQLSATNMLLISQDFGDSAANYYYSITSGTLPAGLSLDASSGKIIGTLASSVESNDTFSVAVIASNPAGSSQVQQVINFKVAVELPPVISITSPPLDNVFAADNLNTFTVSSPLVSFTATNTPVYNYTLEGVLPAGLKFNQATASITGRIIETVPDSRDYFIYTSNAYGQSNIVSFTIVYSILVKPSITYPLVDAVIETSISTETTLADPLITVTALQAFGGTDNYAEGLTDITRNSYAAAGLPVGFNIDQYTGKIYGKLDPSELPVNDVSGAYILNYPIRLGVYNPIGTANQSVLIKFYSTQTPVVLPARSGLPIRASRGIIYTTTVPLFSFQALNNPTSFTVTGLPEGLTITNTGKIIGTLSAEVSAGTYLLSVTATNNYGTSLSEEYSLYLPISLISPTAASSYTLAINEETQELFTVAVSDILSEEEITISVTGLPSGFSFSSGKVAGASNAVGTYFIEVIATSTNYGQARSVVRLQIATSTYSISGKILDKTGSPVQNVLLSDGRNNTALSNLEGKYSLLGLSSGSYNIVAANKNYTLIPAFRQIDISSSSAIDIDFVAEAATRLVRGFIVDESFAGVAGVVVTDGFRQSITNSFGVYELFVSTTSTVTITPQSPLYVFDPAAGTILAGVDDIDFANFSAIASRVAGAPTITAINPGNAELTIEFTPPADDGGQPVTNYEYSITGGTYWKALDPAQAVSPITINDGLTSSGIVALANGTSYSIAIRAVNLSGPGVSSLIFTTTPAAAPAAPTILYHTVNETNVYVFFTLGDSGGSAVSRIAYCLDNATEYTFTDASASPIIIQGLTVGETYILKLKAENSAGLGEASENYTLLVADIPAPPTITSIVPQDAQLLVYFNLPVIEEGAQISDVGYSLNSGDTFSFQETPSTASPLTISGLDNGTFYLVSLQAKNTVDRYSQASNVVIAKPEPLPLAPTNLTAVSINSGIEVSFDSPENNLAAIINYSYQINNDEWVDFSPIQRGSPVQIKNLTNGVEYTVKLRAVAESGYGEASLPVTAKAAKPPTKPTLNTIVEGDTYLEIAFTKPLDLGGLPLQTYKYSIDNGKTYTATTVTDLSETSAKFTVNQLTNGTRYHITLLAATAAGNGTLSNSLSGTPKTVPNPPTDLVAIPADRSVTISFAPPTSNGGSAITNYKYSLNNAAWISVSPASANTSIKITNLTNGILYSFRVKAVNSIGESEASTEVTAVPATIPSAPKITSIYVSSQKLQIGFTPPVNDGGSTITSYEYSIDGGVTYQAVKLLNTGADAPGRTTEPYIIISNLINGTSYPLAIRAVNYIGFGDNSNITTATPIGAPAAPTLLSVSSLTTGLLLKFTPPKSNGGSVITNYEYSIKALNVEGAFEYSRQISPATTISPITITELTPGTSYTVKLRALNSFGAGDASVEMTGTPGAPQIPTITSVVSADSQLTVNFTTENTSGSPITDYLYSIDGGLNYISSGVTTSPVVVNNLINGVSYTIKLRAVNAISISGESLSFAATPTNLPSAPKITALGYKENSLLLYYTAPVSNGGSEVINYKYSLGGASYVSTNSTENPLKLSGLTLGTEYNIYLLASNKNGDGPSSVPLKAIAGAPEAPVITFINPISGKIEIGLSAPSDGGSPILNYEYDFNNSENWKALNPPSTAEIVTLNTEITNNVQYSIRFRAVNARGASNASTPAYIKKGGGLAPTISKVIPQDGGLTLKIAPPDNYIPPITGYKYNVFEYTQPAPDNYVFVSGSTLPETSLQISGLGNMDKYSVLVKAVFSDDQESGVSPIASGTPGKALAPTNLSTISKNNQLLINFTPPESDGGFTITNYEYQAYYSNVDPATLDMWTLLDPPVATSPFIVNGLINDTQYKVRFRAFTEEGPGEISAEVTGTPKAEAPEAPTITKIDAGNASAVITFTAPSTDGGKPITTYQYSINNGNTYIDTLSTQSPFEIYNLTNGTTYAVLLRAVNEVGVGKVSNIFNVTPTAGLTPSAPKITKVTPDKQKLIVDFIPPEIDNGSAITQYQYRLNNSPWTPRNPLGSLTSPINILGLVDSTKYRIYLRAVNSYGAGAASLSAVGETLKTSPKVPKITRVVFNPNEINDNIWTGDMYVEFIPPETGGAAITQYQFSVFMTAGEAGYYLGQPVVMYTVSSSAVYVAQGTASLTVNNVDFASEGPPEEYAYAYRIQMRAVNSEGFGGWSSEDFGFTANPESFTLKAPKDVQASSPSISSIVISFTPPDPVAGYDITGYQYSLDDGFSYSSVVTPVNNTITVTNLTSFTLYKVKLRAYYYNYIFSEASAAVAVTTLASIPTAPTIFAISGLDQQLLVYFGTPLAPGGVITDYEYSLNDGAYVSTNSTSSPITITGTQNNVLYSVKIRAVNQIGAGDSSDAMLAISGYPSAPSSVSLVNDLGQLSIGGAFKIYFSPPASDGGSRIIKYHYSIDNGVTFNFVENPISIERSASPITVSGLVNGQEYKVVLKAENQLGIGLATEAKSIIPSTIPDPPTIVSSSVDSSQLGKFSITFTPPVSTGGTPITGYKYSVNSGPLVTAVVVNNTIQIETDKLFSQNVSKKVKLYALNALGMSGESNQISVSPITAPDYPKITVSQNATNLSQIDVSITPQSDGGSPITHYLYRLYKNGYPLAEQYVSSSNSVFTSDVVFSYGDIVTASARAVNFGSTSPGWPVLETSGVSWNSFLSSSVHLAPLSFEMPFNWVTIKGQTLNKRSNTVSLSIDKILLPTQSGNSYLGADATKMQPLATGVKYSYDGGLTYIDICADIFNANTQGLSVTKNSLDTANNQLTISEQDPNFARLRGNYFSPGINYTLQFVAYNKYATSTPFTYSFFYPVPTPFLNTPSSGNFPEDYNGIEIVNNSYKMTLQRKISLAADSPISVENYVIVDMLLDAECPTLRVTIRDGSNTQLTTIEVPTQNYIIAEGFPDELAKQAFNTTIKPVVAKVTRKTFFQNYIETQIGNASSPGGRYHTSVMIVGFAEGQVLNASFSLKKLDGTEGPATVVALKTVKTEESPTSFAVQPVYNEPPTDFSGEVLNRGVGTKVGAGYHTYLPIIRYYRADAANVLAVKPLEMHIYSIKIYRLPKNVKLAWRFKGQSNFEWKPVAYGKDPIPGFDKYNLSYEDPYYSMNPDNTFYNYFYTGAYTDAGFYSDPEQLAKAPPAFSTYLESPDLFLSDVNVSDAYLFDIYPYNVQELRIFIPKTVLRRMFEFEYSPYMRDDFYPESNKLTDPNCIELITYTATESGQFRAFFIPQQGIGSIIRYNFHLNTTDYPYRPDQGYVGASTTYNDGTVDTTPVTFTTPSPAARNYVKNLYPTYIVS